MHIRSFPRIHIVLLDLGNVTSRKYGGAGFILDGPFVQVNVEHAKTNELKDRDMLDDRGKNDIIDLLESMTRLTREHYSVCIERLPPQHIGLGSKTSLSLAVLKGVREIDSLDASENALIDISGRGGTSGIGVNGFFSGGFIVDCGQDPDNFKEFVPSSVKRKRNRPPVVSRVDISPHWKFLLFLPDGTRFEGKSEIDFFSKNTPLDELEVLRNMASVHHGLTPAFYLGDVKLLRKSLNEIHDTGFTHRILLEQGEDVKSLYYEIRDLDRCAVGLSSMGPLLYAIIEDSDFETRNKIIASAHKLDCVFLGEYRGENHGHRIIGNVSNAD